ncbi:hypothetical protein [Paraburkholderia sp. C35]|uniref:hypothetical protein n=1 Tax=Paraburkholderia sp. C35 TaxID=2126993 RepID=UPI0013A5AE34|nr:hypothetical protein [Paraburkholderia sp. C35]
MSSTLTVIGTGYTGGGVPKVVISAPPAATITGISSSRPWDVQLYSGSTLIYSGKQSSRPPVAGAVPVNYPVNNAAYAATGLSIAYTSSQLLYMNSKSGSDIVLTFA